MTFLEGFPRDLANEYVVTGVLALYVVTSLTIPFWVPILKRITGDCGVFWVFSVLTYYAYLAWVIFALLLAALLYHWPPAGLLWLAVVILRLVQFVRLGARSPSSQLDARGALDEEAPLPLAVDPACPPAEMHNSLQVGAGLCHGAGGVVAEPGCTRSDAGGLGRVLLVGNGPSIRERGLGSSIDGFDTVVRFNSFVTKGLEEHAGSRTTLWCHMMQWYHISTVEIAQKAAWLPTCFAWNHVVLAPLIFVPNYLMPMLPPRSAITWSLATYWRAHRRLGLQLHQVPTTGFVMIVRLLESVDRIHVVGFDGFSSGKELHYYKERRMQIRVNAAGALLHDWVKEQAAIKRLMDEGRLVPL